MSWIIYSEKNEIIDVPLEQSILTIGSHQECDIQVQYKKKSSIHSQVILGDGVLFYIKDESVKLYFLSTILNVDGEKISFKFENSTLFFDKRNSDCEIYECFVSDELQKLFEKIQNSFFDIYPFNIEHKKPSVDIFLSHVCQILQSSYFNSRNVFDELKRKSFHILIWCVWAQIFEYGVLTPSIKNPDISEIMVNGNKDIYFEIEGKIVKSSILFRREYELISLIERICAGVGRRIDESIPYCDARLKEGHRVHAIIPPLSLVGPCLTIRKFPTFSYTLDDLILKGSLSIECLQILKNSVVNKKNIIISGGTGSGKTTFLNCLSALIHEDERIITIEDSAELQLQQAHVIKLECRHENIEQQGEITVRELVKNSLRMRPDRIIIGECRGAEALDMLQAMNTGHSGSMTTIHANSTQDALHRLETLVLYSDVHLPSQIIRAQIASAIHIIVQQTRLSSGKRLVTEITQITGFNDQTKSILTKSLYRCHAKDKYEVY